jgi:hypothetical protein
LSGNALQEDQRHEARQLAGCVVLEEGFAGSWQMPTLPRPRQHARLVEVVQRVQPRALRAGLPWSAEYQMVLQVAQLPQPC